MDRDIAQTLYAWAITDSPSGPELNRLLTSRGHAEWKAAAEIERLRTFIKTVHQTLWDGDVKSAEEMLREEFSRWS